jgi:hypothetical protein
MQRVFISYSHDNDEHKARISHLARRLRDDGLRVIIDHDMLPAGPPQGWPAWSEAQVKDADIVLVACTANYHRRYELQEDPGTGLGVVCEARTIRQLLYNIGGHNEKFRVILFAAEDERFIPMQLQGYHHYALYRGDGYAELRAWLHPQDQISLSPQAQSLAIRWPLPASNYAWLMADRKAICMRFEQMMTGRSMQRILLVEGASKTGKTLLSAELRAYAQHLNLATALIDFKGCPSLDDLFQTLCLDLGPTVLPNACTATGTARLYQLISDLQRLESPLALIFDTYEQASADAQTWLESQLLARLDRAPAVVVVIGGQYIPEHHKYIWSIITDSINLQPIKEVDDWLEFSYRKWGCTWLKPDPVQTLAIATGGDPGLMHALLKTYVQAPGATPTTL